MFFRSDSVNSENAVARTMNTSMGGQQPDSTRFFEYLKIFVRFWGVLTAVDIQFGFRPGRSTTDALTNLLEKIYNALENNTKVLCVFVDSGNAKAFDTIFRSILLEKLHHIE
ncbi:hypothetical protein WA026_016573 [Henosepilachna vigintioctopunctata]|uniref:Reverse transcriptase domain-containing protein n=1 Tax=Henosepilachna vigintioctopunctata TaxID=420089 RepID=A0AAW1VAS0_9CUCU